MCDITLVCVTECDESTEMSCNINGNGLANVTQCILLEHMCDGETDCENGYDESEELCAVEGPGECCFITSYTFIHGC